MVGYNKDAVPTPCEPGVTRRILNYCDEMMMCEITFEKVHVEIFIPIRTFR